ncbi:MAG: LysM peptidoglycan-binding domain-containing protein [Anaerolineales bacterium]|nr:MAG: LysM peptidoglycan-binding domain-containing protein [Anaerolineales bacterium]
MIVETTQTMRARAVATKRPAWHVQPRRLKATLGITAGLAVLATLPVIIVLCMYAYYQVLGIILPGVQVGGVPLQDLTVHEAIAEIDRVWNVDYRITVVDTTELARSWVVMPSEFGLRVDAQASAKQAYSVGRDQGIIAGVTHMVKTWMGGWEVTPWVTFDPIAARAGLEAWRARVEVPSVEGTLALEGGEVVQTIGQVGKNLDIEASLRLLSGDPAAVMLDYRFVPLVMEAVEPTIIEVSATAAEAESVLSSELTIHAYDPVTGERFNWMLTRQEIASWLRIERDQSEFHVVMDDGLLAAYLVELDISLGEHRFLDHAKGLAIVKEDLQNGNSETLLINYQPTSYVVLPTDTMATISFQFGMPYWKIFEFNPTVAARGLVVGERITIPPADAMLTLPAVVNKRIVISISQQRMWVYQDGELFREHVVSTGMSSSSTLPGIFQVQWHYVNAYGSRWDLWMPHFLGIYEASPGFINGIHGLPLLSNGVRLWGNVLGRPASYGCIILDLDEAEELYNWAEDGVVVEIQP